MDINKIGNETLDRIQQEIKENLEREEELRKKHTTNNGIVNNNIDSADNRTSMWLKNNTADDDNMMIKMPHQQQQQVKQPTVAGADALSSSNNTPVTLINGVNHNNNNAAATAVPPIHNNNNTNGFRRFLPNPSAKGVMQKFLKMRGKLNLATIQPPPSSSSTTTNGGGPHHELQQPPDLSAWTTNGDLYGEPAKVTVEPGRAIRNGFVPAEEKMRKELQDFQVREEALRRERRKSQPDLMAALEQEAAADEHNGGLMKPARSMALLYSTEDLRSDDGWSAPGSLKGARSLAELCDACDDELDAPGTHSLIMQFERMKGAKKNCN